MTDELKDRDTMRRDFEREVYKREDESSAGENTVLLVTTPDESPRTAGPDRDPNAWALPVGEKINMVYLDLAEANQLAEAAESRAALAEVNLSKQEDAERRAAQMFERTREQVYRALWNDAVLGNGEYDQGLMCGVEDRGLQKDGYGAMRYGYDRALERVNEAIDALQPEPEQGERTDHDVVGMHLTMKPEQSRET